MIKINKSGTKFNIDKIITRDCHIFVLNISNKNENKLSIKEEKTWSVIKINKIGSKLDIDKIITRGFDIFVSDN